MAYGDIGAIIDSFEFDVADCQHLSMVSVSSNVCAIAYEGVGVHGWLKTVTIESDGQIGAAVIDSLEFDVAYGRYPDIKHVTGDIFAIAYHGPDGDGWLKTVTIESDGQIGAAVIDSLEFDTVNCESPDIIHVTGDIFAIAYQGVIPDSLLVTVSIESDGQIGAAVIDRAGLDTAGYSVGRIVCVSDNIFAIAHMNPDADGWLRTIRIESDGQIGAATIDSLEFDTVKGDYPSIIHVSGDIFAIAYCGPDDDGWLKTVTIESDGQIGAATIDSFEFDTAYGSAPTIIHVSGDIFAISYQGVGLVLDAVTVSIESNGQIGAAVIDSLDSGGTTGNFPRITHVLGDVYAIAYTDSCVDGWISTVGIETEPIGGPQHLPIMGMG